MDLTETDNNEEKKHFVLHELIRNQVIKKIEFFQYDSFFFVLFETTLRLYKWDTAIFSPIDIYKGLKTFSHMNMKINDFHIVKNNKGTKVIIICGERGLVNVVKYNEKMNEFMVKQSIQIIDDDDEKKRSERCSIGYRIDGSNERGIVLCGLMKNSKIYPFRNDDGMINVNGVVNVYFNGVIFDCKFVWRRNEYDFIGYIVSNEIKYDNELIIVQTDWKSVKEVKRISNIKKKNDEKCMMLNIIKNVPNENGKFCVIKGQIISVYKFISSEFINNGQKIDKYDVQMVNEICLQENYNLLISGFGWVKNALYCSTENNILYKVWGFNDNDMLKKKVVSDKIPSANIVVSLIQEEDDIGDDEVIEEEEEEGEEEDKMNDEEEDNDEEELFEDVLLCSGETSFPTCYSINETNGSVMQLYNLYNLSPIIDFEINLNEEFLVCSHSSSLNMIKRGKCCGNIFKSQQEYPGINGMWILKSSLDENGFDNFVVLSFINETRILRVSESIQNLENCSFLKNTPTVGVNCVGINLYVQVTPSKIALVKFEDINDNIGQIINCWKSEKVILSCSISPKTIIVGYSNMIKIVTLSNLKNSGSGDNNVNEMGFKEVSAMKLAEDLTCISQQYNVNFFAIGLYHHKFNIIDVNSLSICGTFDINRFISEEGVTVESIIIERFEKLNSYYLFCGLRNGDVVVLQFIMNEMKQISIKNTFVKKIGVEPVSLMRMNKFPFQFCAVSSRIYGISINDYNGTISLLPTSVKNISHMIPLYTLTNINTMMTVSRVDTLDIWKIDENSRCVVDNFNCGKCYRVILLKNYNCFFIFSEFSNGCFKVLSFLDEVVNEVLQFADKPFGLCEWCSSEDEIDLNEKSQFLAIGNSVGIVYKYLVVEKQKKTSKQKIYFTELLKSVKIGDGIVYCLCRFGKYLISSCDNDVYLLNVDDLKVITKITLRNFVNCIQSSKNRIVFTDRYDSIMYYAITGEDINTPTFKFLQSDSESKNNSIVRLLDDEYLIGIDRDGEFFCMQYSEPILEKSLFNEVLPISSINLHEIPINIRPYINNSFVICTLLGSIYQICFISEKQFKILDFVEKAIEDIQNDILNNKFNDNISSIIDEKMIPILHEKHDSKYIMNDKMNVIDYSFVKLFEKVNQKTQEIIIQRIKQKFGMFLNDDFNLTIQNILQVILSASN